MKAPKDIWHALIGYILKSTKSKSAIVLQEFVKKRVTPWIDLYTNVLVLMALYEQDDIGNRTTTTFNSDFWTA